MIFGIDICWRDSGKSFNVEPTNFGKVYVDEYYYELEHVTPGQQAAGIYMADLTPREILAGFLTSRASYWRAKKEWTNVLEDALLAVELAPRNPAYRVNVLGAWQHAGGVIEQQFLDVAGAEAMDTIRKRFAAQNVPPAESERARIERENAAAAQEMQAMVDQIRRINASPGIPGIPGNSFTTPFVGVPHVPGMPNLDAFNSPQIPNIPGMLPLGPFAPPQFRSISGLAPQAAFPMPQFTTVPIPPLPASAGLNSNPSPLQNEGIPNR